MGLGGIVKAGVGIVKKAVGGGKKDEAQVAAAPVDISSGLMTPITGDVGSAQVPNAGSSQVAVAESADVGGVRIASAADENPSVRLTMQVQDLFNDEDQ